MPYDIDNANPTDGSLVSVFPANERLSRTATEGSLDVEHDYSSGTGEMRHKIGVGDTAARDTVAAAHWVVGSMWFNTDVATGKTLLQVCTVAHAATPTWVTTDLELHSVNGEWTAGQFGVWTDIGGGSPVSSDWEVSNSFYMVADTNPFTLSNPNLPSGDGANVEFQTAIYVITQDAGGGKVINFGNLFVGAFGALPVLSTGLNAVDVLYCTLLPDGNIAVSALLDVG